MTTPTDLAHRYIQLTLRRREVQAQESQLKTELAALETQLLQAFIEAGVQSIRTSDGLAYINRTLWASLQSSPETLLETSLAWLVKSNVNQQSLSSAVREYPRDEDDLPILPLEVRALIKVTEVYKVGVRT